MTLFVEVFAFLVGICWVLNYIINYLWLFLNNVLFYFNTTPTSEWFDYLKNEEYSKKDEEYIYIYIMLKAKIR